MELELLSSLYNMYKNGELNNEFNRTKNRMETSTTLDNIMAEVKKVLPEELSPKQAAQSMRELTTEQVDLAIKLDENKVIDMRKEFLSKMSKNKGALGLVKRYVEAQKTGDSQELEEVNHLLTELAELT